MRRFTRPGGSWEMPSFTVTRWPLDASSSVARGGKQGGGEGRRRGRSASNGGVEREGFVAERERKTCASHHSRGRETRPTTMFAVIKVDSQF